jgi:hypothetical protein
LGNEGRMTGARWEFAGVSRIECEE